MQKFWQIGGYYPFWILASKDKKKSPKEPQEVIIRTINSAFWMELNITLIFCISLFSK